MITIVCIFRLQPRRLTRGRWLRFIKRAPRKGPMEKSGRFRIQQLRRRSSLLPLRLTMELRKSLQQLRDHM